MRATKYAIKYFKFSVERLSSLHQKVLKGHAHKKIRSGEIKWLTLIWLSNFGSRPTFRLSEQRESCFSDWNRENERDLWNYYSCWNRYKVIGILIWSFDDDDGKVPLEKLPCINRSSFCVCIDIFLVKSLNGRCIYIFENIIPLWSIPLWQSKGGGERERDWCWIWKAIVIVRCLPAASAHTHTHAPYPVFVRIDLRPALRFTTPSGALNLSVALVLFVPVNRWEERERALRMKSSQSTREERESSFVWRLREGGNSIFFKKIYIYI